MLPEWGRAERDWLGYRIVLIRCTVARPIVDDDQGILTSTISSTDPWTNSPSAPA